MIKRPSHRFKITITDTTATQTFLEMILLTVFRKTEQETIKILDRKHKICGCYPKEIAEMKVLQVNELSISNKQPINIEMQKEIND